MPSRLTLRPFLRALPPWSVLVLFGALVSCGPDALDLAKVPPPSGDRVLLIGVDAATWDVIRPLMDAGDLPTFKRLVSEGWSGTLQSMEPTVSPAIWTTIATGKTPDQHGIPGFLATTDDGEEVPITSNLRRAETLWTMASRAGRGVNVIGWYVTWPVEKIRGVMVSDRFIPKLDAGLVGGAESLSAEHPGVYPSELLPELEQLIVRPKDFLDTSERSFHERFNIYPVDATRLGIAERVMATHPADLNMVYLWGVDPTQHYFWKYYQPETWPGPPVPEGETFSNRDRIPDYYRDTDAFLARLLATADDRTTVIVVSDHGAGPVERYDPEKPVSGDHRLEGIIMAWGLHVRPGKAATPPSIVDVAPTVLYLLGLPMGDDMRGRVLTELLDPALLQARPPMVVASWETPHEGQPAHALRSKGDADIKDRLRSLGYID